MNASMRTTRLSFIARVTAVAAVLACLACAEKVQAGPPPTATGKVFDSAARVPPVIGNWELFTTGPGPLDFRLFMWDASHTWVYVCTPFGIGPDGVTTMLSWDLVEPFPDPTGDNALPSVGFRGRGRMNITGMLVPLPGVPGVLAAEGNSTQTFDINDEPILNQTTTLFALAGS